MSFFKSVIKQGEKELRIDQYERYMLKWLDCRARMNDNQNAKQIHKRGVNDLRGGGRPRNSWWHEVDNSWKRNVRILEGKKQYMIQQMEAWMVSRDGKQEKI